MISCPAEIFRQAIGYGVLARVGAKKVAMPKRTEMSGYAADGGRSHAEILEYALPGGPVVARKVAACGRTEYWLRADLCTEVLIARADAEAEIDRIKRTLVAEMNARDQVLADARGETLAHFREQRNYRGMKFERWQRAQRAGRG